MTDVIDIALLILYIPSEADDGSPDVMIKTPESLNVGKGDPAPRLVRIGGTTLKIHGTVFRSLVQSEFSLICQGERGWRQIENNSSDYGNICNVRGKKSRSRANGVVCGGKLSLAAPSFLSRQSDFTAFVTAGL